jgi:hypothetical protein
VSAALVVSGDCVDLFFQCVCTKQNCVNRFNIRISANQSICDAYLSVGVLYLLAFLLI